MNIIEWLPTIFIGLMGLAILIYAILDGYDLGVGILLPYQINKRKEANPIHEAHRDRMIASIGPFWDANETWLVLGVGLLLIAFPSAHNIILRELYLPATIMLCGLILRGVAFDFRAKVGSAYLKHSWDGIFKAGSLITALSQGYMLGLYIVGFEYSWATISFAIFSALCVTAAYTYIGGSWLIMKTEGELQQRAIYWTRRTGWLTATGVALVCTVNLWISPEIVSRWLHSIYGILLLPIPLACMGLFWVNDNILKNAAGNEQKPGWSENPEWNQKGCWVPFCSTVIIFILCFSGLAFSFYPYIIPYQLTIEAAASAPESLQFLLWGALFVVPAIVAYTIFSYRVFWGKAEALDYY